MDFRKSDGQQKDQLMSMREYGLLKGLILQELGIEIKGDIRLTLHIKLSQRLKILGLSSYSEYHDFIMGDQTREELYVMASHITNNETFFLREMAQIDVFLELLKDIKRLRHIKKNQKIRILSVPCSSGEEPYSLRISIMESGLFVWGWDVEIVGMDIDKRALAKAENAVYNQNSFRGINGAPGFMQKHFESNEGLFTLRRPYREKVSFTHGNIIKPESFSGMEPFDVIFCRNVLIYMSDDALRRAVENFHGVMADDGYLFVGSSESLIGRTEMFLPHYVQGIVVYRKNPYVTTSKTPEQC